MTEAELKEIEKFYTETLVSRGLIRIHVEALIAEIRRLNKQIADAPIVYGAKDWEWGMCWGEKTDGDDTHCARLVEIKKIGE